MSQRNIRKRNISSALRTQKIDKKLLHIASRSPSPENLNVISEQRIKTKKWTQPLSCSSKNEKEMLSTIQPGKQSLKNTIH